MCFDEATNARSSVISIRVLLPFPWKFTCWRQNRPCLTPTVLISPLGDCDQAIRYHPFCFNPNFKPSPKSTVSCDIAPTLATYGNCSSNTDSAPDVPGPPSRVSQGAGSHHRGTRKGRLGSECIRVVTFPLFKTRAGPPTIIDSNPSHQRLVLVNP